jgi:hypothetical protein
MGSWYFTPKVGIKSSIGKINFGDSPEDVKNILGIPCSQKEDEDFEGKGYFLRFSYIDQDKLVFKFFCKDLKKELVEIVFIFGSLIFEEMEIFRGITKSQLKRYLRKKGCTFKMSRFLYGEYCPEICIEFSSEKDGSGETNKINGVHMFYSEEYWESF